MNPRKHFYSDLSLWALIASNLMVIILALIEKWSLGIILWVYWSQSVTIGILWFFKILSLKEFSTKGFKIGGQSVESTAATKIQTAMFFLVHYGFFHLGYCIFLSAMFRPAKVSAVFVMAAVFIFYQCFSFFYNRKWESKQKPNIGTMMFFPYARILPMHITIIIGGWLQQKAAGTHSANAALLLFMVLKTFADLITHAVERRGFGDRPSRTKGEIISAGVAANKSNHTGSSQEL